MEIELRVFHGFKSFYLKLENINFVFLVLKCWAVRNVFVSFVTWKLCNSDTSLTYTQCLWFHWVMKLICQQTIHIKHADDNLCLKKATNPPDEPIKNPFSRFPSAVLINCSHNQYILKMPPGFTHDVLCFLFFVSFFNNWRRFVFNARVGANFCVWCAMAKKNVSHIIKKFSAIKSENFSLMENQLVWKPTPSIEKNY